MGDDGVVKEVRKLPEHRGKMWQLGTWVIMGDHGLSSPFVVRSCPFAVSPLKSAIKHHIIYHHILVRLSCTHNDFHGTRNFKNRQGLTSHDNQADRTSGQPSCSFVRWTRVEACQVWGGDGGKDAWIFGYSMIP